MIAIGVKYLLNILYALDRLLNAILGGDPEETVSRRAARRQDKWYWRALWVLLERLDKGHMTRILEESKDE